MRLRMIRSVFVLRPAATAHQVYTQKYCEFQREAVRKCYEEQCTVARASGPPPCNNKIA